MIRYDGVAAFQKMIPQVLIPTDDVEGDSGASSLPTDLFLELPAQYGKDRRMEVVSFGCHL